MTHWFLVQLEHKVGDDDVEVPKVGEYDYEVSEREEIPEEDPMPATTGYLPLEEVKYINNLVVN